MPSLDFILDSCSRSIPTAACIVALAIHRAVQSRAWRANQCSGSRIWHSHPLVKHHGLEVIRDTIVHHGTVTVSLDMSLQSLMWMRPLYSARFAGQRPVTEVLKRPHALHCYLVMCEIHECVAEVPLICEIKWQIEEIYGLSKSTGCEHLKHFHR